MLLETNLGEIGPSATMLFVFIQLPGFMWFCLRKWVRTCISQPIKMSQQLARYSSRKRESAFLQCLLMFGQSLVGDHRLHVCLSQRGGQGEKKHVFRLNSCLRGLLPHFFWQDWLSAALNPLRGPKRWSAKLWKLSTRGLLGILGSVH